MAIEVIGFKEHKSKYRPIVYSNFKNTELQNVIDFLLSERSPGRDYPIFLAEWVHNDIQDYSMKKILYSVEQMTRKEMIDLNMVRMKCEDIMEVWDYSLVNTSILKNYGLQVRHVPIILSIESILKYINYILVKKEYDIVFCGGLSEYRSKILSELQRRGKTVKILEHTYGEERDVLIGKAKLLINIHFNENYRVFESIRCEAWLSCGMMVLTETSLDNPTRCTIVPYEELVDKACSLLS